jgi:hypothetical protein
MNERNGAGGDVHERARGLECALSINLGSRSGFIRAPLLQSAIKSGRLHRHAPNVLPLSARPHVWAVDLQLRTSASSYILDKENREAVYEVFT